MLNYLKLVRWPNLLVIIYTMLILRYFLLVPILNTYGVAPVLSDFHFILIVMACVLIAASGYIINDIYDKNIDAINCPELLIIGKYISVRAAENIYLIINILAIAIGVYVSYTINLRSLSLLFPIVAGILYFYSSSYKSVLLFGNIMVALLSAFIPITILLFDLPLLHIKYKPFLDAGNFNFNFVLAWFGFYAIFAFLISLFREIVKDIEDFEGDKSFGKNTLPVKLGVAVSKIVAIIINGITLFLALWIIFKYLHDPISLLYLLSLVVFPLILLILFLVKANKKEDYSRISRLSKLVMLTGISYALIVSVIV